MSNLIPNRMKKAFSLGRRISLAFSEKTALYVQRGRDDMRNGQWKKANGCRQYMAQRYHGWRATTYDENKFCLSRLEEEGQTARAQMVISCCDSRVNAVLFSVPIVARGLFHRKHRKSCLPPFRSLTATITGTSAAGGICWSRA